MDRRQRARARARLGCGGAIQKRRAPPRSGRQCDAAGGAGAGDGRREWRERGAHFAPTAQRRGAAMADAQGAADESEAKLAPTPAEDPTKLTAGTVGATVAAAATDPSAEELRAKLKKRCAVRGR
eukprot:scaffold1343_cov369-Prasinococcus_capsulatus_cf.AAC.8